MNELDKIINVLSGDMGYTWEYFSFRDKNSKEIAVICHKINEKQNITEDIMVGKCANCSETTFGNYKFIEYMRQSYTITSMKYCDE